MDYTDSSLVARAKLCRLLLQLRDEAKWLPCPPSDENITPGVDSMLFPVQGTHILKTAYCLPVFNILIKTCLTRGMVAVLLHFSTGVRAYMVLPSLDSYKQWIICCLCKKYAGSSVCVCTFHTWTGNSILSTHILIKNPSNEGRGSHFASSLDWSKSLHSFTLATSDESV